MTCKKCGKEMNEGQRFCGYCGADQQESPDFEHTPPGPEYDGQPQVGGAGLDSSAVGAVLKIFAVVCALVYGVRALANLFGAVNNVVYLVSWFNFWNILYAAISLLTAVIYVWMCVVMVVMALRRDPDNSETLFLGLCGGGALAVVMVVLRLLLRLLAALWNGFYILRYYSWGKLVFLPLAGNVIAVGGVFLLLYLMGEAPLMGKRGDEIKAEASDIFNVLGAAFASFKKEPSVQPGQADFQQSGPQQTWENQDVSRAGFQPDPGAYRPPVNMGPLKTDRSLVVYILLNIITCGIYGYYFLYTMARDVNVVCSGDGQKTGGLLAFILLSFITCGFYALYWYYSLGNRLAANAPRYGLNFQENGTTVLLWYLIGLLLCGIGPYVAMHFLIRNTNSLCAAYNQINGLYGR